MSSFPFTVHSGFETLIFRNGKLEKFHPVKVETALWDVNYRQQTHEGTSSLHNLSLNPI